MNTVKSLQALYVKLGGNLTDTYSGIAGGIPVGDYSLIPDMIQACTQKAGSGGGGGADELLVEFTLTEEDSSFTVATETSIADILAAVEADKIIRCKAVLISTSTSDEETFTVTSTSVGMLYNSLVMETGEASTELVVFGLYIYGEGNPDPSQLSAITGLNEGTDDTWTFVPYSSGT